MLLVCSIPCLVMGGIKYMGVPCCTKKPSESLLRVLQQHIGEIRNYSCEKMRYFQYLFQLASNCHPYLSVADYPTPRPNPHSKAFE